MKYLHQVSLSAFARCNCSVPIILLSIRYNMYAKRPQPRSFTQAVHYAIWFRASDFNFSIWKKMGLLRPILMQLDLQSVEEVAFSAFAWGFALKMFEIGLGFATQLDRKSADGDFLQLGPWRSGKQLWMDFGGISDSFCGEEDQFPTFFWEKAHANVLKGALSTDCWYAIRYEIMKWCY